MTLAQRRAPVNAVMRRSTVSVSRFYYGDMRDLYARFYIGAGQAAEHRKVEGKKESQHAHRSKGKCPP